MNDISIYTVAKICRPARIVTFIDSNEPNWINNCMSIIKNYSQQWGGKHNIIIPTDGNEIKDEFWYILERFDPDYCCFFSQDTNFEISPPLKNEIIKRINPFHFRGDPTIEIPRGATLSNSLIKMLPYLNINKIIEIEINMEEIYQIFGYSIFGNSDILLKNIQNEIDDLKTRWLSLRRQTSEYRINMLESLNFQKKVCNDSILDLLVKSVWGERFEKAEFEYWQQIGGKKLKKEEIINEEDFNLLPFSIADTGLVLSSLAWFKKEHLRQPAFIIFGDFLEDFCLWKSLYSLSGAAFWIPNQKILQSSHALGDILERILLKESVIITSLSKSDKLPEIEDELKKTFSGGIKVIISKTPAQFLRCPLVIYERESIRYEAEQFISQIGVNFIDTPVPKSFKPFIDHHWISQLIIRENYLLPQKSILANKVLINYPEPDTTCVRVTKEGIAYLPFHYFTIGESVQENIQKPKMKLLSGMEIFTEIFKSSGYEIRLSDKGSFLNESQTKFGSLKEMAEILRNDSYRELFDICISDKPNEKDVYDEGILIRDADLHEKKKYLNLVTIKKRLKEEEVPKFIENLCYKGILHRGFALKCERCRNADWYGINEVNVTFKCKRCGLIQGFTSKQLQLQKQKFEPEWIYKLDEVVYQGYRQGMLVTILTLAKLDSLKKESFIFIPEIEIPRTNKLPDEIDICAILDGDIIIGECKKQAELNDAIIKKYKKYALAIGAREVIFSTSDDDWTQPLKTNIDAEFSDKKIKVEFFTRKDLFPLP